MTNFKIDNAEVVENFSAGHNKSYANGCCDAGAVVIAVRDALETGKPQHLIIAKHHLEGGENIQYLSFGLSKNLKNCMRWCGENDDPDGNGSHSVIISGLSYSLDESLLIATITLNAAIIAAKNGAMIFRDLHDLKQNQEES